MCAGTSTQFALVGALILSGLQAAQCLQRPHAPHLPRQAVRYANVTASSPTSFSTGSYPTSFSTESYPTVHPAVSSYHYNSTEEPTGIIIPSNATLSFDPTITPAPELCVGATAYVRDAALLTWHPRMLLWNVNQVRYVYSNSTPRRLLAYDIRPPALEPPDLATALIYPYPMVGADGVERTAAPNLPVTVNNVFESHPDLPPGTYPIDKITWPETLSTDYTVPLVPAATPPVVIAEQSAALAFNVLEIERPTPTVDSSGTFSCMTQTETSVMPNGVSMPYTDVIPDNATTVQAALPTDLFSAEFGSRSLTAGTWTAVPTLIVEIEAAWNMPWNIFAPQVETPGTEFEMPGEPDPSDRVPADETTSARVGVNVVVPSSDRPSETITTIISGSIVVTTRAAVSTIVPQSTVRSASRSSRPSRQTDWSGPASPAIGLPGPTQRPAAPAQDSHQRPDQPDQPSQGQIPPPGWPSSPGNAQFPPPQQTAVLIPSPSRNAAQTAPSAQSVKQDPSPITQAPITVAAAVLMPTSTVVVLVGGQHLVPGAPPITAGSHTFSLPPRGTSIIVDSTTLPLPPLSASASPKATTSFMIANSIITIRSGPAYLVDKTDNILVPDGGPVVLGSGTTLSLGRSALAVMIAGSTSYIGGPSPSVVAGGRMGNAAAAVPPPVLTIGSLTYTGTVLPNGELGFVVAGQTLLPGHAITAALPANTLATATADGIDSSNGAAEVLTVLLDADGQLATVVGHGTALGVQRTATQTLRTLSSRLLAGTESTSVPSSPTSSGSNSSDDGTSNSDGNSSGAGRIIDRPTTTTLCAVASLLLVAISTI